MYGGNTKTIAIPIYTVLPYCVIRAQIKPTLDRTKLIPKATLINPFTTGVLVLIGRTHRLERSSAIDTCKFMK